MRRAAIAITGCLFPLCLPAYAEDMLTRYGFALSTYQINSSVGVGRAELVDLTPGTSLAAGQFGGLWYIREDKATLTSPLGIDASVAGTMTNLSDLTPANIPAGTTVGSFLVHFDRIEPNGPTSRAERVSVSAGTRILGIQLLSPTLISADTMFVVPGVTFDSSADRAIEVGEDVITIQPDYRTIDFSLADGYLDEFRVLVAVPEPAWGGVLAGSVFVLALGRRRGPVSDSPSD